MIKTILLFLVISVSCVFSKTENTKEDYKLLSKSSYVFPYALPNDTIIFEKLLIDNKIIYRSNSKQYKTKKDLYKLKLEDDKLYKHKGGCISREFYTLLDNSSEQDIFNVSICLKSGSDINNFIKQSAIEDAIIDSKELFHCEINKSKILALAFNNDVKSIEQFISPLPTSGGDEGCNDFNDYYNYYTPEKFIAAGYMVPAGQTMPPWGLGDPDVNCATFEEGITTNFTNFIASEISQVYNIPNTNLGVIDAGDGSAWYKSPGPGKGGDHGHMTFYCMSMATPNSTLNHGKYNGYGATSVQWLIDNNIETISYSYDNSFCGYEMENITYNAITRPVLCHPTANSNIWFSANGTNYNGISVGGVTPIDFKYYEIVENNLWTERKNNNGYNSAKYQTDVRYTLTQTKNPSNSDRELPHIVAPSSMSCSKYGTLWGTKNPEATNLNFRDIGGTSAAAPLTNGIAASVIGSNKTVMKNRPENVKVALMVTAVNVDGGYWDPNVDGLDGCGTINGYGAVNYAHSLTGSQQLNNDPVETGIAYGELPLTTTDNTILTYNLKTPSSFPDGKHLRAVLTWTSSVNVSQSESVISDIDLIFRKDSEVIKACASNDDNVEVVDLEHKELEPNQEYSLDIIVNEMVSTVNGLPSADHIRYSLGWTWVDDYAGKELNHTHIYANNYTDYALNRTKVIKDCEFKPGSKSNIYYGGNLYFKGNVKVEKGSELKITPTRLVSHYFEYSSSSDLSTNNRPAIRLPGSAYTSTAYGKFGRSRGIKLVNSSGDAAKLKCMAKSITYPSYNEPHPEYNGFTLSTFVGFNKTQADFLDANSFDLYSAINNTNSNQGFKVRFANGCFTFLVGDENGNFKVVSTNRLSDTDFQGSNKYPDDAWLNVTVSWKPNEFMKIYINGNIVVNETNNVPGSYYAINDGHLINSNSSHVGSFGPFINDMKFFSGALTDHQVSGVVHIENWPEYKG